MKISFESMGRAYELDEKEGAAATEMFHVAAAMIGDIKLIGADRLEAAGSVYRFAGHKMGEAAAKYTLKGCVCDGVVIDEKTWPELFESKGKRIEPFAAAIRIWKEHGFLEGCGI